MSDLFWIALLWIAIAAACAVIARIKGQSAFLWFVRGLAGGLLSLGYLLMTPSD